MSAKMTLERATQFGAAWNSHDVEKVVSFFADNGEYHASFGSELFGASYVGRDQIRKGVVAKKKPEVPIPGTEGMGIVEGLSAWAEPPRQAPCQYTFIACCP